MSRITGKQRRHLRSLGHHLKPVVQLGQRGVTEEVVNKTVAELDNHELVKLKVGQGSVAGPKEFGPQLAEACGAELVQVIGRTFLLYRARAKDPEIQLP